jgi:hypothetical protein
MSMELGDKSLEEIVAKHNSILLGAADAFMRDEIRRRKVFTILFLVEIQKTFESFDDSRDFGSVFTIEAILLIYDLFATIDKGWRGGSLPGKLPNIERGREDAQRQLLKDYFMGADSTYPESKFRRRFRMRQELFLRIVRELENNDEYFQQRPDATGKLGASALQKATAALRMLAYGGCADQLDEWIRLGESTILLCLKRFVKGIIRFFGEEYLRAPTEADIMRVLQQNAKRGFPGCVGSIDCWHWEWKNCPSGWAAQYKGKKGKGCVAEMCCGPDLWIWHLFCGNPGSLNDINILQRSPLLRQIYNETMPKVEFEVNGKRYSCPYWLADGIYPQLAVFVLGFAVPNTPIDKNFTYWQESVRKDIERAFGVLQARWGILTKPALSALLHTFPRGIVIDKRQMLKETLAWIVEADMSSWPVKKPLFILDRCYGWGLRK